MLYHSNVQYLTRFNNILIGFFSITDLNKKTSVEMWSRWKFSFGEKNSMRFITIFHFSFVAPESISDLLSEDIGFFPTILWNGWKSPDFFNQYSSSKIFIFFLNKNKTFQNREKNSEKHFFVVMRNKRLKSFRGSGYFI